MHAKNIAEIRHRYMVLRVTTYVTVTAIVLSLLGWVITLQIGFNASGDCTRKWGQDFTQRYQLVVEVVNYRADALDELVRSIRESRSDPSVFNRALESYLKASDLYKKVHKENPIPDPPTFNC